MNSSTPTSILSSSLMPLTQEEGVIAASGPKTIPWFTFFAEGVLLLVVSLIGCAGNIISAVGLARDRGRKRVMSFRSGVQLDNQGNSNRANHFTVLLIALALFDLLYLAMGILIFGLPTLSKAYKDSVFPRLLPVW